MPDWQKVCMIIGLLSAIMGLVEMTYRNNKSVLMFFLSFMLLGLVLLSEMGSWAGDRINLWIIAEQAQPEWHDGQKKLINKWTARVDNDFRSPAICGDRANFDDWRDHRDRILLHNGVIAEYRRAVMQYAQGSQYRGVEKVLPQELQPCPAPSQKHF